jgi:hypothetical protein
LPLSTRLFALIFSLADSSRDRGTQFSSSHWEVVVYQLYPYYSQALGLCLCYPHIRDSCWPYHCGLFIYKSTFVKQRLLHGAVIQKHHQRFGSLLWSTMQMACFFFAQQLKCTNVPYLLSAPSTGNKTSEMVGNGSNNGCMSAA